MTTKAVRALFWKEYRQQYLLWVALFAVCVLAQAGMYVGYRLDNTSMQVTPAYATMAMFFTALYAAGAASILFAAEHEDKTYQFLRSLPIPGSTILVGKVGWLLASTLSFGGAILILSMIWNFITPSSDRASWVFAVMGVGVLEGLAWGLFWTTRCRTQWVALLLTFFSASFGAYFMAALQAGNHYDPDIIMQGYADGYGYRLLLTLVVGAVGVWNAKNWIYRRFNASTHNMLQPGAYTSWQVRQQIALTTPPKRGEFRWLCWHAFRQSRALLLTALITSTVAILWLAFLVSLDHGYITWRFGVDINWMSWVLFCAAAGTLFILCSSVFYQDQKCKRAAMLTHLGISPKKFWWSRILVFGSVYFAPLVVFAVCLVVYLIYYVYQHGYLPFGETYGDVAREQTVIFFNIVTAYFALFCLGQLVSFLTRSFPIAFVSTLGLCLVPWCWGNFLYWYGIGVFWATMPILIGCLVADWMRGRDTLRSFAVSLSAIAIPFVCVLALIPAVRVYSVPVISLGYKLEIPKDALSPEETKKTCNLTLDRLYAGTGDVAQMRANWQYIQQMIADPKYPMYHHEPGRYASVLFVKIQQDLKDDSLTAEHWKETAAFLEKEMPDMQNMQTWIQQSVERAYGAALYDLNHNRVQSQPVPWHIRLMPWEYARVKRVLANDFQFLPRVAYKQLSLDRGFNTSGQWKYERYLKYRCDNGPQIFSDFYKNARETSDQRQSCNVYDVEQNRSVTMLLCALKCYQMEHGELPETLEQLEGKSIDRLPVTFASRPYKFYRNMDDLSEEQMLEIAEWHPDFRESSFNNSFGSDSGTSPGGMSSSGSSMGAWETRDRIMRFLDNIPPELRGKQFPYFYNRDGSLNEPGRRLLENTSEKIKKLPPQLFDGQRWFPIEFAKEK